MWQPALRAAANKNQLANRGFLPVNRNSSKLVCSCRLAILWSMVAQDRKVLREDAIATARCVARMLVGCVAAGSIAALLAVDSAAATPLVTAEEAQLPADDSRGRVGIERGVDIVPVYPTPKSGAVQSPFNFRVKFRSHGNTEIDLDSLVVVYKKIPEIDLTQRLRPFVQPDGINMPSAEVPPGAHRILIFLWDSVGHGGEADIRFEVEK
jgi:hypothetical protein